MLFTRAILPILLLLAGSADAASINLPNLTILGTDVFNPISANVPTEVSPTDSFVGIVTGTVDLASGSFSANAAGVIIEPPTTNTGGRPGEVTLNDGFPFASILVNDGSTPFRPLFLADADAGFGSPAPPTRLTLNRTFADIFGPTFTGLAAGAPIFYRINDTNTGDNSGQFTLAGTPSPPLSPPIPEPGTAALLCVGLGILAVRRRKPRS